ncbi:AMP-binding protein, partial [Lysinibacillus sp. NPDC059133]|uniref:AMP-binding protein n=1 Tax=Lysinibacillus sp. NPDC059133 TaxID=3346737 RepID=UPI0036D17A40
MGFLSPQQRYLSELENNDSSYSYLVHYTFSLEGTLNITVFEDTIKEFWINNNTFQYTDAICPSIKFYDFSKYGEPAQIQQISEISKYALKGDSNAIRCHFESILVKLSKQKHLLILTSSALNSDINTQLIMDKIAHIYSLKLDGVQSNNNQVPFIRVSEWLNKVEKSEEKIYSKQYWVDKLIQTETQEDLFLSDKVNQSENIQRSGPRIKKISIPTDNYVITRMKNLINGEHDISDYLLAIWTLLLSRLTNNKNLTIGYYCEGRTARHLKGVMGPISKYVPLSVNIDEEYTKLSEHLDNVRNLVRESKESQIEFNWESIKQYLNTIEGIYSDSYFKYGFDYEEIQSTEIGTDLKMKVQSIFLNIDKNDLRISCVNDNYSVTLNLYYDSYKFSEDNMNRVLLEYHSLLLNSLEGISRKCLEVGFDKEDEIKFNSSKKKLHFHNEFLFHKEFERCASQYPDIKALVYGDTSLSYKELNQLTNKYAALLKKKGVQKGDIVAISMERTFKYIIGILAVIKVGAAYLPIDSNYPLERVKYFINDSEVNLLLTDCYQELTEIEQVIVSTVLDSKENYPDIDNNIEPYDLIYTIYTSGSTGVP